MMDNNNDKEIDAVNISTNTPTERPELFSFLYYPSVASPLAVVILPLLLYTLHSLNIILPNACFTSLSITVLLVFLLYYYMYVVKKPELYCGPGKLFNMLVEQCTLVNELYWPTPWFLPPHASSILAHIIRATRLSINKYTKEFIHLCDGGEIALHWIATENIKDNTPIALFIAGIHGDSHTAYLRLMIGDAKRLGYRCVVFHNRGLGGAEIKTPRLYCGANVDDFKEALEYIRNKYPQAPILATGCSLGGLHVMKYLMDSKENSIIDYAMTVSMPWDSYIASANMEATPLNLLLNKFLVAKSLQMVNRGRHLFEKLDHVDLNHVFQSKTHKEFDERFTTKVFGFDDLNHHYDEQTMRGKLHHIKIPVLALNSSDDHFSPHSSLPIDECANSDNIALLVTSHGGHIGFMDGLIPKMPFLMERLFCQYASAVLPLLVSKSEIS